MCVGAAFVGHRHSQPARFKLAARGNSSRYTRAVRVRVLCPRPLSPMAPKAVPPTSFDGKPLCKLAASVPKPRPTNDATAGAQAQMQRDCLVRIIDHLVKKPEHTMSVHNLMMCHDLDELANPNAANKSDAIWTGDYKQVERLPRAWLSEYLLHRAKKLKVDNIVTPQVLSKIEEASSHGLQLLFHYETQLSGPLSLPPALSDQTVASLTMHARADEVGNRLVELVRQGGFALIGKVNFLQGGCYTLEWSDAGKLVSVKHVTGPTATVLGHVHVDRCFELVDNHSDSGARLVRAPTKYVLHEFFGEDAPFKQFMHISSKRFKRLHELSAKVVTTLEDEEEQKTSRVVKSDLRVLQPAATKRAAANLNKAREKLEESKAKRAAMRCLSLGGGEAAAPITAA